jgi:hypothetical protein
MTTQDYSVLAGPQAAGAPAADVSQTMAAAGVPGTGDGWFSGVKDFLKQNKDIISLGTGALGVGNAIWKNSQMQGGLDALIEQANAARMSTQMFQNSYNQLWQQAQPLIQAGMNGELTPAQAANVMATAQRMKQEIQGKYAGLGGQQQGGTNEQQDLNNVDLIIAGLQNAMAMSTLGAGINLIGAGDKIAGLNGGINSSIGQLARANMASDIELQQALTGFATAAGRGGANA